MWDSGFLGLSQKPGTVPRLWDCPQTLGLSLDFGTVPKARSPDIMGFYFQSNCFKKNQILKMWGSGFLTVPKARNRTVPGFWQSPRSLSSPGTLGLSQEPGTVPILRFSTHAVGPFFSRLMNCQLFPGLFCNNYTRPPPSRFLQISLLFQ